MSPVASRNLSLKFISLSAPGYMGACSSEGPTQFLNSQIIMLSGDSRIMSHSTIYTLGDAGASHATVAPIPWQMVSLIFALPTNGSPMHSEYPSFAGLIHG